MLLGGVHVPLSCWLPGSLRIKQIRRSRWVFLGPAKTGKTKHFLVFYSASGVTQLPKGRQNKLMRIVVMRILLQGCPLVVYWVRAAGDLARTSSPDFDAVVVRYAGDQINMRQTTGVTWTGSK